jgi:biotin operon repressor
LGLKRRLYGVLEPNGYRHLLLLALPSDVHSRNAVAEIGGTAFTVYCAIKAHVDFNTGESFPSQKLLAEQTGFSERQIIRSLKTLEQHGLLEKTREHTRNLYRLKERLVIDKTMVATWDGSVAKIFETTAYSI